MLASLIDNDFLNTNMSKTFCRSFQIVALMMSTVMIMVVMMMVMVMVMMTVVKFLQMVLSVKAKESVCLSFCLAF